MSGGETDDVATYATEPNQSTNAFNLNFSLDELLYLWESKRFVEIFQMCILQDKIIFNLFFKSLSIFKQGFKRLDSIIKNV